MPGLSITPVCAGAPFTRTIAILGAILSALMLFCCAAADAGEVAGNPTGNAIDDERYLPAGALQYDKQVLANGFTLISQRVPGAPYVSARLLVRVGTGHYACDRTELPHLLEHLLFSGNRLRPEEEIEDVVSTWGGNINAHTGAASTTVELDLHRHYLREGVALLADLVRGFDPAPGTVAREMDIVANEVGNQNSSLQMWWLQQPFTQTAGTRFSVDSGIICGNISPVRDLDLAQVKQAFAANYVAPNMVLFLVGGFDDAGLQAAREAFGALPSAPMPHNQLPGLRMPPSEQSFVSGWLSGTRQLNEPSAWALAPFHDWAGYYALSLVESWMSERMYQDLRSKRGLTYTPSATVSAVGDWLLVGVSVETPAASASDVQEYMREMLRQVGEQGIPEEDFERLRRGALLGMSQSLERVSARADYLADSIDEIDAGGIFDDEEFYRGLDYATFRKLLARDWPERFSFMDNSPRLPWPWVIGGLVGSMLLLLVGIALFAWKRLRRRALPTPAERE